jgi:hypothetical protein
MPRLRGSTTGSLSLHLPVSLAGPEPSGSTGPSRRCRGFPSTPCASKAQTEAAPFGPATIAYGHTGTGGSVHGAWPQLKTGFSYATNTLHESRGPDPRPAALLRALHDALMSTSTKNIEVADDVVSQ